MNGILNVFKPEGITSYGVIREVKRICKEKKVGHTGTLDPLAKGVLPLFLGKMTKLIPHFNNDSKTYRVTARLGGGSTTHDREGEITPVQVPADCTIDRVGDELNSMVGQIDQIPPLYSAIKVKGKKLYQYARKGEAVERHPRRITVFSITDIDGEIPDFRFTVHCSKGTYIRAIVRDIGRALGTEAYMTDLVRIRCGAFFTAENALTLDEIINLEKSDLQKFFIDPQYLLPDWHVATVQSDEKLTYISQGREISLSPEDIHLSPKGKTFIYAMVKDRQNRLIATGHLEFSQDDPGMFHPSSVYI